MRDIRDGATGHGMGMTGVGINRFSVGWLGQYERFDWVDTVRPGRREGSEVSV